MPIQYTTINQIINNDKIDLLNYPIISDNVYQNRINELYKLSEQKKIDCLILYGDREHFSNIEYLTKYDPRFEECLLILKNGVKPKIIVGLEGEAYSGIIPYEIDRFVYSGFGLLGQPSTGAALKQVLMDCGIKNGVKIGIVGWKTFLPDEFENAQSIFDLPNYIIEILSQLTGKQNLFNVTDFMVDNRYGLRNTLCFEEIVHSEIINTKASRQVYSAISNLKEGMSEIEASEFFGIDGDPMITYPAMSFGEKNVKLGLASPMYNTALKRGDIVSVGIGYRRAMIHRSAVFVEDEKEFLNFFTQDILDFYKGYFDVVRIWYENLALGAAGGEIYRAVLKEIGSLQKYGIVLNMGHQIHTEEWINSIFYQNSDHTVRSGMAIQCDIIAGRENPFVTAHVEDGIVIADEMTRKKIQQEYPAAYLRMQNRRKFMKDILHIHLKDEVLPLSDIQGMLFPFVADNKTILTHQ